MSARVFASLGEALRKFRYKSSLGGRLLLAIALIAGFPAATGVLGWFELQDVSRSQSRVVTEAIPAISEVRGVVEETGRVVAMAPELAAVTDEAQRKDRSDFLYAQADALRDRLSRHRGIAGCRMWRWPMPCRPRCRCAQRLPRLTSRCAAASA